MAYNILETNYGPCIQISFLDEVVNPVSVTFTYEILNIKFVFIKAANNFRL